MTWIFITALIIFISFSQTFAKGFGSDGPPCIDVANKKIRLGDNPGVSNPWNLAIGAKYIEQLTGYEITWQRIYGGGHAIRMLDEGQICMSLVGSSPIATAQLRGSKMELIGMLDVIGDAERLVVKEHIVSPMDLEGKTLVTVTDSTAQFHLLLIEKFFGVKFGKVYDNNSIKDADGNPITFEEAWDTDLVDGIYMWGGTQKYAADNGGHTLIGSAELGAWDKPIFDGFASRTDVSGLDPVFTATLLGVMGTLNKAYVSKTPREWAYTSSEMKTSLAFTGAVTEAKFESFMEYANGLFFQDVDEMRSCSHIGCGLRGIDAQALKAVNTFKMDIKAATNMRADNLWENSTNAKYLNLAASQGYGVIADIDNWDQTERDNIIANYTTINHHGFAWHTGTNSGTAPHDGQCSGTVTISSDGSFSDGHLTGLSYHDYADCTWVLDSGTASGTTTVSLSFLDIAGGWDTLTISDSSGDVLAVFSGLVTPPPISAVGPLTVKFQTDGRPQMFAADKEAGFIASVAFTTTPPATCPQGKYGADCSSDYCYGKTTMINSGTITTQHRNLARCSWELIASEGKVVRLEFSAMALEYSNDIIEVFDSDGTTLLGRFSGFSPPPKLVSSGTTMTVKLIADDLVWQDQGFTASFTSVATPELPTCEAGKFGPFCDSDTCFGSVVISASPTNKEGIILSGDNFPGGVNCDWVIGEDTSSSHESVIVTFNEIDIEPDPALEGHIPDQLVFKDGNSGDVLYTVRGRSSTCSRDKDCNPNQDSASPSSCSFANQADVFGVCVCEEGYVNGDCSERVVKLTPTGGFLTIKYETDINDPSVFEGWNLTYSLCGGNGFGPCEMEAEIAVASEDVITTEAIIAIAASFIVVVALVVGYFRMQSIKLEKTIKQDHKELASMKKENEQLHENLKMLQKYSQAELDMIDAQIATFRKDFSKKKGLDGGATTMDAKKGLEKLLISASDLESEEVLGKGSFGEVHKSKYHGQYVAVKTLNEVDQENLDRFQTEILLMADLHHSNVVQLVGACWEKDLMALVMEFCEKGMSSDFARTEGSNFSWDDPLLKWSMDLSRAMRYLHSITYNDVKMNTVVSGIIHRDLKPDNCLVTDTYTIKVADFGEARAFNENNTMTQVGTPMYISPEIVRGDKYTTQADVFSFALTVLAWSLKGRETLLQFLFLNVMSDRTKGRVTMANPSVGRVSHALVNKGWRPRKKVLLELGIPQTLCDLLSLCWLNEPEERPSFGEILEYLETAAMQEIMPDNTQKSEGGGGGTNRTRRTSTSGALQSRISAQRYNERQDNEDDRKGQVDAGIKNLIELFDVDGDGKINEQELQFARTIIKGVVKGRLGKDEIGDESAYLEKLKGDELKARIEEDEKAEEELKEASDYLKQRLEMRKNKRVEFSQGLEN